MGKKSYDGSPCVYLVPTPIGNMDDITLRAIRILESVSAIFSEDTRVTGLLLNHLGIKNKLISSHNFNESRNDEKLLDFLSNGESIAIVSDRGTPAISDPGYELVLCAIKNEYNVVSLPGPTAFVPALTVSGLDISHFTFYGFLDSKSSHRLKELENLKFHRETLIFYESPRRVIDMLNDIVSVMGNRNVSISREISKRYEEVYRGKILDVISELEGVKGELVIVVSGCDNDNSYNEMSIFEHVLFYKTMGNSDMESIKMVAKERGVPKSIIYNEYHNLEKR